MGTKVFISYRREDSKYQAREIYAAFSRAIPADHVFFDNDSIPLGADFDKVLKDRVGQCDVLLALIGPHWIDDLQRLNDPADYVRIEVGEALARDIPVVPVLIDVAKLPDAAGLPVELKKLVMRQGEFLAYRTFLQDVDQLVKKVVDGARERTAARSLAEYRRQAESTARELSELFGREMPSPPIQLAPPDTANAFWDGMTVLIPAGLEDIPDLIVNELAIPFIKSVWDFTWEGQSGALATSYRDVVTSMVKQHRQRQTAAQADWTIAPGAFARLYRIRDAGNDQRPIRSLKAPGSAYTDPTVGKDPQVAHFRDLVRTADDWGGVHTNSGIPNKAFYEAAMKIGTDAAGRIWLDALQKFKPDVDFPTASRTVVGVARQLHGVRSPEAVVVRAAWKTVGL
jgi:Thermolysin metallopeptidase, alpha-helical domain/TIR domain